MGVCSRMNFLSIGEFALNTPIIANFRHELLAAVQGDVLEIGFSQLPICVSLSWWSAGVFHTHSVASRTWWDEDPRQRDDRSECTIAIGEDPRFSVEKQQVVDPGGDEVAAVACLSRKVSQSLFPDGERAGDAVQTLGHNKSDGR